MRIWRALSWSPLIPKQGRIKIIDFRVRLNRFGSNKCRELRAGQTLVLDEYAANHEQTRDLAIEMPTGDGKTLVALLIADSALDKGRSVAYLTGTRQLADGLLHVWLTAVVTDHAA